jgi:hypothetical protein
MKGRTGMIKDAYLDGGDMGSLIALDNCDLLDGDFGGREPGTGEVVSLEFAQSLLVELRLKLLEDKSKV